jgi:hypothetical protein
MDICRLCKEERPLKSSHIESAGIFFRLREPSLPNPNPVLVTRTKMIQTSAQIQVPLLCDPCEQCFNERGEKWVLSKCRQSPSSFPLAETLSLCQPIASTDDTAIYRADDCIDVDVNQLIYFAASIFWRASVYRPPFDRRENPVRLGPYEEEFRRFLRDLDAFPRKSALWVTVIPPDRATPVFLPPYGRKDSYEGVSCHCYTFSCHGLTLDLFLGKTIPPICRRYCIVTTPGHFLVKSSLAGERLNKAAIGLLAEFHRRNGDIRTLR